MEIVKQVEAASQSPRLSQILFEKRPASFASLATFAGNVDAVEASLLFATGFAKFVALYGSSGWGKTHLLCAVEGRLRLDGIGCIPPVAAEKFLEEPARYNDPNPLLLDDCQEVFGKTKPKAMFRIALESRLRGEHPTMLCFTASRLSRPMRLALPQTREWSLCQVGAPEPPERVHLINQMAEEDGLALAPSLVRVIAKDIQGNGRTLAGALKRLRLSSANWTDSESVLRACGLLEPFFADNSSWDLKHRILRAAEAFKGSLHGIVWQDLSVYIMLRVAQLAEADVARAMDLEPAAAYLAASRFERHIKQNPRSAAAVRQFIETLVNQFVVD
jgi:chromosomal replication initiation ATPase DnaA